MGSGRVIHRTYVPAVVFHVEEDSGLGVGAAAERVGVPEEGDRCDVRAQRQEGVGQPLLRGLGVGAYTRSLSSST